MEDSPRKRRKNQHLSFPTEVRADCSLRLPCLMFPEIIAQMQTCTVLPSSLLLSPLLIRRCSVLELTQNKAHLCSLCACIPMEWLLSLCAARKQSKQSSPFIDFQNPKGFEIMPLPLKPEGLEATAWETGNKENVFESVPSAIQNRSAECVPPVLAFHSH